MTMGLSLIDLGWIPYLNLRPLRLEIEKSMEGVFRFDNAHPSMVLKRLVEGKVQIAPCSSIGLVKYPGLDIAVPLGVVGNRRVKSVYLGLKGKAVEALSERLDQRLPILKGELLDCTETLPGKPRQIATMFWKSLDQIYPEKCQIPYQIRFSSHSESSVALAKLFLRMFLDYPTHKSLQTIATHSHNDHGSIELVIGDEALQREKEFQKTIDLGAFWYEWTGMNFVFAVWQGQDIQLPASVQQKLLACAEASEVKMKFPSNSYLVDSYRSDGMPIDLIDYWKAINYRLHSQDLTSLMLYLCMAKPFVSEALSESLIVKMHRWKDRAIHA
jgi:predicted solute-binding protein